MLGLVVQALVQADHAEQALAVAALIENLKGRVQVLNTCTECLIALGRLDIAQHVARTALAAASQAGRDAVFATLAQLAPMLAALDQGETLWQIYEAIQEVEGWWGAM